MKLQEDTSVLGKLQSVTEDLDLCMWSQRWLGESLLELGPGSPSDQRYRREERAEPVSSAWPQPLASGTLASSQPGTGCLTQTTG